MKTRPAAEKFLSEAGITLNGKQPCDPHIRDERVFFRTYLWGTLGLGDAYVDGWWECDRLDEFFYKVIHHQLDRRVGGVSEHLWNLRDSMINVQSVRRAFQVAEHHYDLGNELYEGMLGESMGYSSAYFGTGASDLTQAQFAKFDAACRQLGFKKGMKVLEIGCGWGTFAAYAAEHYGVEVLGVTVSKEQLAYAEKICAGKPIQFFFGDYRTLPKHLEGTFDAVVSIEMIEAVGLKNLRTYMDVASRMLKRDGAFLVQAILGTGDPDVWISTRIFPNGVLPSMVQMAKSIEGLFRISHLESFGLDYDKTLMAWDERFRASWPALSVLKDEAGKPRYDERFYRMWRYYLMVCAGSFRARKIDVAQILLTKTGVAAH